jgi:methylenetetrahydrofolate reductase (NADPH)
MSLRSTLASGAFTITAELGPPRDPDPEIVRVKARALSGVVDAANVTDNQAATVKLSPLAASVWMREEGLEPILQLTTRDRNLLALQSDLLAAWALGVESVLTLFGDPLEVGPYASTATRVGDVDALELMRLVLDMNEGRLAAGEEIRTPTDFLLIGAANPFRDTVERLESKLAAGVRCFQTNIVYDVERFASWFAPVVAAGLPDRAPFLVGVSPPRSVRALRNMHDNIPGIDVDAATFARLDGLEGDAAADAGIDLAVDVVRCLRELDGVGGIHVMAPGWEAEAVPRVVAGAGLRPSDRDPAGG